MADKRKLSSVVAPHLTALGFRKRAGELYTIVLAPGILGWLGLNRATRHRAPGEVEINPVVGVRFQEVERVVAECRGDKFHDYIPPTISSPLGYLMPANKYRAWIIAPGCEEPEAADMTAAIAAYGIPFMRSVTDLGELSRRLEEGLGHQHQLAYRRPVVAFLANDIARARGLLDMEIAAIGTRTDPAAADFKKFAAALRDRLPSPSGH